MGNLEKLAVNRPLLYFFSVVQQEKKMSEMQLESSLNSFPRITFLERPHIWQAPYASQCYHGSSRRRKCAPCFFFTANTSTKTFMHTHIHTDQQNIQTHSYEYTHETHTHEHTDETYRQSHTYTIKHIQHTKDAPLPFRLMGPATSYTKTDLPHHHCKIINFKICLKITPKCV